MAADVYDKYGEEGVDAMVKAWESQKDKSAQPEWNAIHAVMMAEAATRYKDEVSKEAEVMGLDKDEKTVEMIQKALAAKCVGLERLARAGGAGACPQHASRL